MLSIVWNCYFINYFQYDNFKFKQKYKNVTALKKLVYLSSAIDIASALSYNWLYENKLRATLQFPLSKGTIN